ncbi:MAG: hypothetical protein C5B58_00755 [Acidobacteria bacterium]|nr:MAG: hypothetical protein C5B58_00755 [Acidobacteriota bacterium]
MLRPCFAYTGFQPSENGVPGRGPRNAARRSRINRVPSQLGSLNYNRQASPPQKNGGFRKEPVTSVQARVWPSNALRAQISRNESVSTFWFLIRMEDVDANLA